MAEQQNRMWDFMSEGAAEKNRPAPKKPAPQDATDTMKGGEGPRAFDVAAAAGLAGGPPPVAESIEETGLPRIFVQDLILKCVYFEGRARGTDIAHYLCISYNALEEMLDYLKEQAFLAVVGGGMAFGKQRMEYSMTDKGRVKVQEILIRDNYYGPAPVPMEVFVRRADIQSINRFHITPERVKQSFSKLILDPIVVERIGPAINSGRSIFLYGPPGNGKTALATCITDAIGGEVYLPKTLYIDRQIVKLYDNLYHVDVPQSTEEALKTDKRWVKCKRPIVMVGGELTLETLDLVTHGEATFYEAPFQLKATNGVLFIDDFGRQRCVPQDLLNRWIVPLESRFDFLTFASGLKVRTPFDCLLVFSTNLDPKQLVDDAFLRRIRYKIGVEDPTEVAYRKIFDVFSKAKGVALEPGVVDYLIDKHYRGKRPFRACQPRDLMEQLIDIAKFTGIKVTMTPEIVDRLCAAYFVEV